MQCKKCGAEIPDESIFCNICGKKQTREPRKKLKNGNGYGCVRKLPGRRKRPWAVYVTDSYDGTKQVRRYVSYHATQKEALIALEKEHISPSSPKSKYTLTELYEEWKETSVFTSLSQSTQWNYISAYKLLKPLHNTKFIDIRTKHIQSVIDNSDKSNSTKSKIKLLCSLLYKYALENDICQKNYAQFVKLTKQEKAEKEVFTSEEIKTFFENDAVPYVDTILILIYTGLRINEMLTLTKENIDIENKVIVGGLKTDAGKNRTVPIHDKIFDYVKKWYEKAKEPTDLVFVKDNGETLTDNYYRKYIYYPLLKKFNMPKRTPHCTRHTCATLLAEAGADINAIKQILGHSQYSFTADTYTHVDTQFLANEMKKI